MKPAPFESLGVVSYSPSIVTIAVSVAVCEIFSVKEWCDLENRVRVRSRSLEMAPFDRSHTSFYSPSIVTITLSCTVTHYDDMLSHFHLIPERHGWTDSVLTCDKNRNNLLMKLAGSTWGANANTLRSSALTLCYSVAEYCAPVWSCSAHTSQVDVQLNTTMRLISGTCILHLSHGFQCFPTLNRQPYVGRLPRTSCWRKSLNMTVGQPSLISLTHHCYD